DQCSFYGELGGLVYEDYVDYKQVKLCKLPKHIYNTLCQIEYTLEEKHEEFTVLMRASNKIKVPIYKYDFVFPQGDCEIGQCSLYGELDDLVYEDYVDYKKVLLSNL